MTDIVEKEINRPTAGYLGVLVLDSIEEVRKVSRYDPSREYVASYVLHLTVARTNDKLYLVEKPNSDLVGQLNALAILEKEMPKRITFEYSRYGDKLIVRPYREKT